MARLNGSSPEAQPALHTRSGPFGRSRSRAGTIVVRSSSQASESLKKLVRLMRIMLKSAVNSSGCTWRKSRYSS